MQIIYNYKHEKAMSLGYVYNVAAILVIFYGT